MGTIAEFYDLEASKLIADGKKVALFTNHPGTLGAFREARLRQYLIDHVPHGYVVRSGFISYSDKNSEDISDTASKQIDCLVYESRNQAALLETSDFVCIEAKNAAAIVEIKSTLGINRTFAPNKAPPSDDFPFEKDGRGYRWGGTLMDALENIVSAIGVMTQAERVRRDYHASIFAYEGDQLGLLDDALRSGELIKQLGADDIDQLPDCICVLTKGWWDFSAYEDTDPPGHGTYDPSKSWLNKTTRADLKGMPLQWFTAYFAVNIQNQTGAAYKVGGLRSGMGRTYQSTGIMFDLPSPGKG